MTIFKIPIQSVLLGIIAFVGMAVLSYYLGNDAECRNHLVLDGGVFVGYPMTMWGHGGFSTGGTVVYKVGALLDFACALGAGHLLYMVWLAMKKRSPPPSSQP